MIKYIIINHPQNTVWGKDRVYYNSKWEAEQEMGTQLAKVGGVNNGWEIEEKYFKDKEDDKFGDF